MDTLSEEKLRQVPWFFLEGQSPLAPPEPPINEINQMVSVPFMKRDRKYPLFYSWAEIVKLVPQRTCTILDAACGRGIISQILFLKGHKVYACDIIAHFKGDKKIDFRIVDLNKNFPYPDSLFDIVICCEGLEYFESTGHFLKETRRILKNKGHLLLSIPHISSFVGRYNFFRKGILIAYDVDLPNRRNIMYLPLLQELLKYEEFEIIKIKGNVPLLTKKTKLFNALFGNFIFDTKNDAIKFAHSLIIDAELKK